MRQYITKHLVALRECGCIGLILTTNHPGMDASEDKIKAFHREVNEAMTRKDNPVTLTVREVSGKAKVPWTCPKCNPNGVRT